MAQLRFIIMRSDLNTELDFFNLGMMLLALFFLLGQFVLVLSKVSDATDRRGRIR